MQCPEAHLFCTTCMMSYAETKLGEHDARIVCMDQSGCKLPFPDSELRRCLTPKLLELYERVKQRKEIEAAGLDGLEECPFCDYKVVIENEQERQGGVCSSRPPTVGSHRNTYCQPLGRPLLPPVGRLRVFTR